MKRRVLTAFGTLTAALLLAATTATTAHAADGVLTINYTAYRDPAGCYQISGFFPYKIDNRTDENAVVHTGWRCDGERLALVRPGETHYGELGHSLYIP
ncbi:hypothetical protein [Nocardiopsis aegyptia]|uniref:Secreted protein n=1 Tax=Nocardiopsis aegyptia TaxID=220378 RepID=A0A7Z0J9Y3_9ACTN|nr:hypothetical protein [Nocardiopsis aegyptia]NYJ34546.1 hypothetical protein [Nocardiopsis aegyptia]